MRTLPPLFAGADNLEEFVFASEEVQYLHLFIFPNLVVLKLSTWLIEGFNAMGLLDFLKASPMLQTVEMEIFAGILLEDVTRETFITLPSVETFSLLVIDDTRIYDFATHLSCPRAEYVSLAQNLYFSRLTTDPIMFPASALWDTIVHQYARSPVEEVTIEMNPVNPDRFTAVVEHSHIFRSSDTSVLRLCLRVYNSNVDANDLLMSPEEVDLQAFFQACETIRDHPLLSHVKRFHIKHRNRVSGAEGMRFVAGGLFKSLGPLDELTIQGGDLLGYLEPFVNPLEFGGIKRVLPPVKHLTISRPWFDEEGMEALLELAESQHRLGIPFERVTMELPTEMAEGLKATAEGLKRWVATVDCPELNE